MNKKIILVVGMSYGIGYAVTERLLEMGYFVIGLARQKASIINNENFQYIQCDITSEEECKNFKTLLYKRVEHLDGLINVAGICKSGDLESLSPKEFEKNFEVNVFGTYRICKITYDLLHKSEGTIINISSDMSTIVVKKKVGYSASKAALNELSKCIALSFPELKVHTVLPGITKTELFYKKMIEKKTNENSYMKDVYPLQRLGNVVDIVNSIIFLLDNVNTSGIPIFVNGGAQL
ncbi:MAG: SDR family oxidoreductase [Longicatena sp.]